jgi:hypothetical protein
MRDAYASSWRGEGASGSAERTESTSRKTIGNRTLAISLAWRADLGPSKGDVMPDLPTRPDLEQIRHQAKDLLRAARSGDGESLVRIRAVSPRLTLASAQLAVAREYGFANWPKLKLEVQRREVLDDRDVNGLRALLVEDAALATRSLEHWCDHPNGASPLAYLAMLRYHTSRGVWRDLPGTGDVARALVDAGALIDGADFASLGSRPPPPVGSAVHDEFRAPTSSTRKRLRPGRG